MKKQTWQIIVPLVLVIITMVIYVISTGKEGKEPEIIKVEKGLFEVVVSVTGELEALEYQQILVPEVLTNRFVRIRNLSITDLVREGTVVKKGDYVATLDPSDVEDRTRQAEDLLERYQNNLENALIDSSLVLSDARSQIRQAKDNLFDMEINVEQSIYESQAVQRQAQINLERAQRDLDQQTRNYQQTLRRHELYIGRLMDRVSDAEKRYQLLQQLKIDLIVTAPADGMVVYARGNNGQKIRVGSNVSGWDPLIATLPDLTTIQSVVNVKEIDISKIKTGLPVRIRIDAYPEDRFNGKITRIANVGQDQSDDFFNVFRVEIEVFPEGKTLLPGMTSTNNIVVESVNDALLIPRMAVYTEIEGVYYVYKREGLSSIVKQEISIAGENDTYYSIIEGAFEGDRIMMCPPSNAELLKLVSL